MQVVLYKRKFTTNFLSDHGDKTNVNNEEGIVSSMNNSRTIISHRKKENSPYLIQYTKVSYIEAYIQKSKL